MAGDIGSKGGEDALHHCQHLCQHVFVLELVSRGAVEILPQATQMVEVGMVS